MLMHLWASVKSHSRLGMQREGFGHLGVLRPGPLVKHAGPGCLGASGEKGNTRKGKTGLGERNTGCTLNFYLLHSVCPVIHFGKCWS